MLWILSWWLIRAFRALWWKTEIHLLLKWATHFNSQLSQLSLWVFRDCVIEEQEVVCCSQTLFWGRNASGIWFALRLPPARHKTEVNGFQMSVWERERARDVYFRWMKGRQSSEFKPWRLNVPSVRKLTGREGCVLLLGRCWPISVWAISQAVINSLHHFENNLSVFKLWTRPSG